MYQGRWYSGNCACHGLAGDGDFLLDLADFTGDERYRAWARDLAAIMDARHVLRDDAPVLADESLANVSAAYSTGLAGILAFLLRLRHRGPRLWLPDELLRPRPQAGES